MDVFIFVVIKLSNVMEMLLLVGCLQLKLIEGIASRLKALCLCSAQQ